MRYLIHLKSPQNLVNAETCDQLFEECYPIETTTELDLQGQELSGSIFSISTKKFC